MKIIYMGTPEFALKPLQSLYDAGHEILAVVCQPDKVNARGGKIIYSPTKRYALEKGIPVLQYKSIRKEGVEELAKIGADVIVTCAYGQILSQEIIDMCKYGVINIHSSMLPKYRGASPMIASLLNGDELTGISIVKTDIGLDDGDILYSKTLSIEKEDNSITLSEKMSELGSMCILHVLSDIEYFIQNKKSQNHDEATFCSKVSKEMAKLDFSKSAIELVREIKAFALNPTSYFMYNQERFKVYNAEIYGEIEKEAGIVCFCDKTNGLVIACGDKNAIKITQIQSQNGKVLPIKAFVNGRKLEVGTRCE